MYKFYNPLNIIIIIIRYPPGNFSLCALVSWFSINVVGQINYDLFLKNFWF